MGYCRDVYAMRVSGFAAVLNFGGKFQVKDHVVIGPRDLIVEQGRELLAKPGHKDRQVGNAVNFLHRPPQSGLCNDRDAALH